MSSNAEAWFKDTDKEVEIVKQQVRETTWENADGERSEIDISSFIERIETDYKQLKKDVLSSFDIKE